MEEKKVIRMDEHKNKNKVHKLSGKKILLGIVAVLILTVVIIAGTCKTKQIKISGLSYYTEAEVKKAVVENGYIDNSVAYFLKCKIASPDLLPFIDSIHVRINRPDTITVEVKEYGYYWAVTGNAGTVSKKTMEQKPLELGRIYIDNSNINTFKERLRYSYWVGYLKERGINIHFFKSL